MATELETDYANLVQFLYSCPVGLIEVLEDGSVGTINPHAMQLLMPIVGNRPLTDFFGILETYAPEIRQLLRASEGKRGTVCDAHRLFVNSDNNPVSAVPNVLSCTLVRLSSGRYLATISDVSAQVLQEKRLRQAEVWFASLLEGTKDFTAVSIDSDGCVESASPSIYNQTGYSETELGGMPISLFYADTGDKNRATVAEQLAIAKRDGWHLEEDWNQRKDGERYWCQRLIVVRTESIENQESSVRGYTVVFRSIERQSSDICELKKRLSSDHLTGALNRGTFFDQSERELANSRRSGSPLGFIVLDIDHFKAINDTHGHDAGDVVLQQFAKTCTSVLRHSELFARMGGEEFAVLLPQTDRTTTLAVAERIRIAVENMNIEIDGKTLRVTVSIGCANSDDMTGSVRDLLSAADGALYEVKRNGRNRTLGAFDKKAAA